MCVTFSPLDVISNYLLFNILYKFTTNNRTAFIIFQNLNVNISD